MALWTPAEIATDVWLDAADSSTITIDTGVSEWADKSGKNNDATQTDTGSQPVVNSAALGGLDTILFTADYFTFLTQLSGMKAAFIVSTNFQGSPATTQLSPIVGVEGNFSGDHAFIRTDEVGTYDISIDGGNATTGNASVNGVDLIAGANISFGMSIAEKAEPNMWYMDWDSSVLIDWIGRITTSAASYMLDGEIAEVIFLDYVPLEENRQKIEGYLAWKWGLEANLPVDHPYKSSAPGEEVSLQVRASLVQGYDLETDLVRAVISQLYHMTVAKRAQFDQLYGMRMIAIFAQLYGDTPQFRAVLDQYYGDNPILRKIFTSMYGDAYTYRAAFDQEWNMPAGLRNILVMKYGLAEAQIRAMCEQNYRMLDRDLLRAQLQQLYVLAAGEALVQSIDIKVTADNNGDVRNISSAYNIDLEQNEDDFHFNNELQLFSQDEYLFFKHLRTEVTITIDGVDYLCLPEEPRRIRPGKAINYIVPLVSKTILLEHNESPYSQAPDGMYSGMAKDLVQELAAVVCSIDWRMVNWFIPPNVLYCNGETRMAMIKKIVVAAGGLVQTSRENVLICRPEYPDSVNTWATADPCLVLADQDSFFSITPSPSLRSGYNKFFISNEDAQTDGLRMEDLQITASRREVRVFMVPWDDSAKIVLRHSGGSWVQIVADGVVTNEESQEVEFVSGAGQVAKPYYGDLVVDYKERGLGNVIADEDGTLTAAVVDHSLAQVGYLTKYHRFYVTDTKTENVQVYPEVTYD